MQPENVKMTESKQRMAVTMSEHIGMALSNLRLHETLRSQSIRDPLTGLFNRRFMEESGVRVALFSAAYAEQEDGREVIGYDTRIEGADGWILADDSVVDIPNLGRWRRGQLFNQGGRRRIVLYRYTIANRPTASRLAAKLWQGLSGLAGDRSASVFAVSTPCQGSCDDAGADLVRFLTDTSVVPSETSCE